MKLWSLFPVLKGDMPFQLALDEILFRGTLLEEVPDICRSWLEKISSKPILRFYYSTPRWKSIGYSAQLENLKREEGVRICRRITGGGLVEHGEDLLLSLLGNKNDDASFSSVRVSYWKIHEAIREGLKKERVLVDFVRCDKQLPRGAECFRYPIATDLVYQKTKIAGGAQKRSYGRFLHQESLKMKKCWHQGTLIQSFQESFSELFQVKIQPLPLQPEILEYAKHFAKQHYREWESVNERA